MVTYCVSEAHLYNVQSETSDDKFQNCLGTFYPVTENPYLLK